MSIVCLLVLIMIIKLDERLNDRKLTPLYLLSVVYLLGIVTANTIGVLFDYYEVSIESVIYLESFLMEILLISCAIKCFYLKSGCYINYKEKIYITYPQIIYCAYVVITLIFSAYFYTVFDVQDVFFVKGKSSGIVGHLGLLGLSMTPLIAYQYKKKKSLKYLLPVVVLLGVSMLFSKYYVCISMAAIAIFFVGNKKISLKLMCKFLLGALFFGMVIFIVVYALVPIVFSEEMSLEFLAATIDEAVEHFLFYFLAPFICQNTYFTLGEAYDLKNGLEVIFNPFITLYEFFLGDKAYPNIIMNDWAPISEYAHASHSNVGGIFSEAVYWIGNWAYVYIFLISMGVYYFYYHSLFKRKYRLTNSFLMAIFMFCYFCNFFSLMTIFEMLVYAFVLDMIFLRLE